MVLDGLKSVERRLLYTLFELAKKNYVKSAKVVGHCIGNYHPHGDVSTYGALVSMVNSDLAQGQGNWGIDVGVVNNPPAAQRYTEVRCSKDILEMAFEYIEYVDRDELEMDEEPVYLATKYPICLVSKTNTQGIGFGYKCVIPNYATEDLKQRLAWLLGYRKREPIIKPISNCELKSDDATYKQLLTTGKAKLEFQGICEINPANKSVIIRSIPPNRTFMRILESFKKEVEIEKSIGITDESTTSTKVRLHILRQRGFPLDKLVEKVVSQLKGTMTYECNMSDQSGKCVLVSVDQMLLYAYNNYKKTVDRYFTVNIAKLEERIAEMNLIQKIKEVLPDSLRAYSNDADGLINDVHIKTTIEKDKVKSLFDKYTITRLLKVRVDIAKIKAEKLVLETDLANLETYLWDNKY